MQSQPGEITMTRFIPANAEARDFPAAAVIAYCYETPNGPAFVAYKGRRSKPSRFYSFRCVERRDENLADFVRQETEVEDCKRKRRETGHGLIVGDIVYSSWGYEQTNVDFFEVVRVPSSRSAVVRKVEKQTTLSEQGRMCGEVMPKPGMYVKSAKESTRRAAGLHSLNGGKLAYGVLNKWDGKPKSVTWYA